MLDIPKPETHTILGLETQRRRSQRLCAQRIARHRILNQSPKTAEVISRCETNGLLGLNGYTSVIFMNQHDIVLGVDQAGRIDIVRLPRYGSEGSTEVLGIKLASKVELQPRCENLTFSKLKSIQSGEAFAVGLPSGEFRVFATERAASWRAQNHTTQQIHLQQNMTQHRIHLDAWRFIGPKRRYHRDHVDRSYSLLYMLDNLRGNPVLYNMMQVMDWSVNNSLTRMNGQSSENLNDWLPSGRYRSCDDDARWDFRDTQSGLQAAFVDQENDCFYLRVLDDRTKQSSSQPKLVIDADSKDDASSCREDITSICFVSEHYLATSHVWKNDEDRNPTNVLKLWDIRMMSSRKSVVKNLLPSFPLDSIYRATANTMWLTKVDSNEFEDCQLSSLPYEIASDWSCPFYVSRLSSSTEGVGTIMVTLQGSSGPKQVEHLIFNPCTGTIVHRHRTSTAPYHAEFAISPTHDLFASYQCGNHSSTKICFYDFLSRKKDEKNQSTKLCRKRFKDNLGCVSKVEDGKGYLGGISSNLCDRDDIPSRLTTLAFNDTGTSLVGGTLDGDMFVWRGG